MEHSLGFTPLPLPKRLCWHFRKNGSCARGDSCKFLHEAPTPMPPPNDRDIYWLFRMPKDATEYHLLTDTLEAHGYW